MIRERGVSTAKPELIEFSHSVNQAFIFDIYMAELERKRKEAEEKENQKKDGGDGAPAKDRDGKRERTLYSKSFVRCLKIMERMIVQNNES